MPSTTKQFYRLIHHFGQNKVAPNGEDRVVKSSPRIRRSGYIFVCGTACTEYMKNPTAIKLCISHKIATSRGPSLKSYCPNKSNFKNYLQQIHLSTLPAYSAGHYHPVLLQP